MREREEILERECKLCENNKSRLRVYDEESMESALRENE